MFRIIKLTVKEFIDDGCPRMAAALSYYTVFSLPALLILIMVITGVFVDPADIRGQILLELERMIGPTAADLMQEVLEHANRPGSGRPLTIVFSVAAILFAGTTAFAQLQTTLNRAWEVKANPRRGGIFSFIVKRALSFAMILVMASLLLISMWIQALLAPMGDLVAAPLPDPFSALFLQFVSTGFTLFMAMLFFAIIFEVVPDAKVKWRDSWKGALVTAILFVLGNYLMGLYFSHSSPGSAFGGASSLALVLVWVYYSAVNYHALKDVACPYPLIHPKRRARHGGPLTRARPGGL